MAVVMWFRAALMACILTAPALAQDSGEIPLRSAMLDQHNAARRSYGVEAIVWDETLVVSARQHARHLAATGTFEHAEQDETDEPEGENLFMGTRSAFSYAAMAQLWVDERHAFRPGKFPDVVKSGHWSKVGHYTQIIWPTTKRVGCALASSARDDYLVCRYLPAGNFIGTELRQKTAATILANASAR